MRFNERYLCRHAFEREREREICMHACAVRSCIHTKIHRCTYTHSIIHTLNVDGACLVCVCDERELKYSVFATMTHILLICTQMTSLFYNVTFRMTQ